MQTSEFKETGLDKEEKKQDLSTRREVMEIHMFVRFPRVLQGDIKKMPTTMENDSVSFDLTRFDQEMVHCTLFNQICLGDLVE